MSASMEKRLEMFAQLSDRALGEMHAAAVITINRRVVKLALEEGKPTVDIVSMTGRHTIDPRTYEQGLIDEEKS